MATRSTIALEFADGTVQQVYCHWDGYLDHNGRILQAHYMDPFKVRDLIELGSLSILGAEIGDARPFDNPHKYGSPEYHEFSEKYKNQCVAYHRDRGEELHVNKFANFADYAKNHQYEEYEYILRQVDGKPVWFVYCYDNNNYEPLTVVFDRQSENEEV